MIPFILFFFFFFVLCMHFKWILCYVTQHKFARGKRAAVMRMEFFCDFCLFEYILIAPKSKAFENAAPYHRYDRRDGTVCTRDLNHKHELWTMNDDKRQKNKKKKVKREKNGTKKLKICTRKTNTIWNGEVFISLCDSRISFVLTLVITSDDDYWVRITMILDKQNGSTTFHIHLRNEFNLRHTTFFCHLITTVHQHELSKFLSHVIFFLSL